MMERKEFLAHATEFRKRFLKALLVFGIICLLLMPFSRQLFYQFALPILAELPKGQLLIATSVIAPVFIPIKLALFLSLLLSMPYMLYQFWGFVAEGLYKQERKFLWISLSLSSILFYAGIAFAFFVVFPIIFKFFISFTPAGVSATPDISEYFSFCLKLLFAFGLAFEVPIVVTVVLYTGLTTVKKLRYYRPYVIVFAFVFGMLLTPPDVFSQILLAIPVCILYECGIFLGGYLVNDKKKLIKC